MLHSSPLRVQGAKPVRILSEIVEPEQRFAACNGACAGTGGGAYIASQPLVMHPPSARFAAAVKNTILFFGSARARSADDHAKAKLKAEAAIADAATTDAERDRQRVILSRLEKTAWMCDVYVQVEELARRLAAWSMGRITPDGKVPYIIATGECSPVDGMPVMA